MTLTTYKHKQTNHTLNNVIFDDKTVSFVLDGITKSMVLVAFLASYTLVEW